MPYYILQARNLARADGRSLFAYKVSDQEFDRLRETTAAALRASRINADSGAAFVLFAAEWWRRHFEGGSFAFYPVFEVLDHQGLDPATRAHLIAEGLQWWGRPVRLRRDGNSMYLFSLVAEGGFPTRLLVNSKAHFHRFFTGLLEYVAGVPSAELRKLAGQSDELANIGRRWAHLLPSSLRVDDLLSLSAELVAELWLLREQAGTRPAQRSWPDHLDQVVPDWRTLLPLRLDEAAATALLQGLLVDADRVATLQPVQRLSWSIRAEVSDNVVKLVRELQLPRFISKETMARLAGLDADGEPTSRYTVWAVDGANGLRERLCDLVPSSQRANCWVADVAADGTRLPQAFLTGNLALEVVSRNLTRHFTREVPGALGPASNSPWVFSREIITAGVQRLTLRGYGSMSRADDQLWMAVPSSANVTGAVTPLAWSASKYSAPLAWFVVEGAADVSLADQHWVVKARCAHETSSDYIIRGKTIEWHQGPRPVYCAFPAIAVGDPERTIPVTQLEIAGISGQWRPASQHPGAWGRLSVRHRTNDGALRFQAEIDVAPPGLTARPIWGSPVLPGSWLFQSQAIASATLELPDAPLPERQAQGFLIIWPAIPGDSDCADVMLSGGGPGFPFRLDLRVATPLVKLTAVDRTGAPLPSGSTVHLAKLAGVRVRATAHHKVVMTIRVRVSRPNEADQALNRPQLTREVPPSPDGVPIEVDLASVCDDVVKVLAASSELDAIARVAFRFVGGPPVSVFIDVQRYDWRLEPLLVNGQMCFNLTGTIPEDALCLEAIRLADVLSAPEVLARAEDGFWRFASPPALGTWLLLARDQNWYRGRPLAKFVGPAPENWSALTPIGAAMEIPNKIARSTELRSVLMAMGLDYAHPSWPEFLEFCRLAARVPAPAFDVLKEVRHVPSAAALAVLLAETEGDALRFAGALTEMNYLWELVPLQSWDRAIAEYMRMFPPQVNPTIAIKTLASRLTALVSVVPAAMHAALDWALDNDIPPAVLGVGADVANSKDLAPETRALIARNVVLPDWHQLLRVRADDRWPTFEPSPEQVYNSILAQIPLSARLAAEPIRTHVYQPEQQAVADAPVIAAVAARFGLKLKPDLVFDLWMARDFAPLYFNVQYKFVLSALPTA